MTLTAIYGCWRGHSTKLVCKDKVLPVYQICSKCPEICTLYSVLEDVPTLRSQIKVVEGGIHDQENN